MRPWTRPGGVAAGRRAPGPGGLAQGPLPRTSCVLEPGLWAPLAVGLLCRRAWLGRHSLGGVRWSSGASGFHSLQAKGVHPPRLLWSRDKPPSSEDAWKGRWGVLSKADSPPLAPPWSPHRVWGSLLLPIPLSAESPRPWAPSRLSGRLSLVTAAVGRWASVGGAAAGRGPPPLPRCLGKLLRGTGAPGSSEAPGLPRAALLAGGGACLPRSKGRVGAAGVSPPRTRNCQETGAAPGGDGWVESAKGGSLFKGVCSPKRGGLERGQ